MVTAARPIAERLGFSWVPSTNPAYAWDVVIIEHLKTKDRPTRYCVDVVERAAVEGVVYLFAKHPDHKGPTENEVYETWVGPGGVGWCSCAGTIYRHGAIVCRHRLAVEDFLNNQEEIP